MKKGLYGKYEKRKTETGELVEGNYFVLRPDRDVWLEHGIKFNKNLYPNGGHCSYCDEFTDRLRPSPFLADSSAEMCRDCWNMSKEEYAASNGEYIPEFDDYPHWKGDAK